MSCGWHLKQTYISFWLQAKESEDSAMNRNSDTSSYFNELGEESNSDHVQKKTKLSPKKKSERARRMDPPTMDPPVLQAVSKLETLAKNIRQDEFDTFGLHVASQLRSLPLANAIICQNFINNYLSQERLKILNAQHLPISRPTSSLSEYTRYSSTPEPEATTSRNQASTFRSQRNTSTPEASTSGNYLEYEEDYFASCFLTQENTAQQSEVNDDILSQAVRSCLDENTLQNL